MQLTYDIVKTTVLNQLKVAQRQFNKNPNSTHWQVLTTMMLTHQQIIALRRDNNLHYLIERLEGHSLGDWPEAIVRHATGLSVRDVLAPSITNV